MSRKLVLFSLGVLVCSLLFSYFLLFWLRFNFLYERAWFTIHNVLPVLLYLLLPLALLTAGLLLYGETLKRLLLISDIPWVLLIFTVALGVRLVHIALIPTQPVSDFQWYHDRAVNLLTQGIYGFGNEPAATFPPGTSLFFAAIYTVVETPNIIYPKIAQAILGAVSVILIYCLSQEAIESRTARIAALMLAFFPSHIAFTSVLASENLFTFLNLLFLFLLLAKPFRHLLVNYFLVGLGIGLSALVRPVNLPLLFLVVADLLLSFRSYGPNPRKAIAYLLIATAGYCVLLIPWGVRNYLYFNTFSIASSSGGIDLWIGNNPYATGLWMDMKPQIEEQFADLSDLNVYQQDRLFRQQAVSFIINHPHRFFKLYSKKILLLFSGDTEVLWWSMTGDGVIADKALRERIANLTPLIAAVYNSYFFAVLGLAVLGLPRYFRGLGTRYKWNSILLVICIAYYMLVYPLFFSGQRFHFNLMAIMTIFASLALSGVLQLPLEPTTDNR